MANFPVIPALNILNMTVLRITVCKDMYNKCILYEYNVVYVNSDYTGIDN